MSSNADSSGSSGLSPDAAFTVLGNETRIEILQTLGEADGTLSFTTLRDRVGVPQGGQFNYHLEKLVGHFVEKTDEGYGLREPGRRVVQAILSGAVTDDPELDRTGIDDRCWWCGSPMEMSYVAGRLNLYCTDCDGTYDDLSARRPSAVRQCTGTVPADHGFLGNLFLPPAGVTNRTPEEAYRAAWVWEILEYLALANEMCPRCSGTIDATVRVCTDHDATDGRCENCGNQHAIHLDVACSNCVYRNQVVFVHTLYGNPNFLAFLASHGMSPLTSESVIQLVHTIVPFDEEIVSTEPFEARFTFAAGDDTIVLTVDDTFDVVDLTAHQ